MGPSVRASLALALTLAAGAAGAQTTVPGGTLTTRTWSLAGSPYLVQGDVTIPAGETLTVEAGVVVRFAAGDDQAGGRDAALAELTVAGALVAAGTPGAPVTFTGDSPAPGAWYGIVLAPTASGSSLANVVVERPYTGLLLQATGANAYDGVEIRGAQGTGAMIVAGAPTLSRLRVVEAGGAGVYVAAASPTLLGCEVRGGATHGVVVTGGAALTLALDHCTIAGNAGRGLYDTVTPAAGIDVTGSVVAANGAEGIFRGISTINLSYSDVWGHSTNLLGVTPGPGCISSNPLFVSPTDLTLTSNSPARFGAADGSDMGALPYLGDETPGLAGTLWGDRALTLAGSPWAVTGDLTVPQGVTLTLEPGVVLSFAATDGMAAGLNVNKAELTVRGTLVADGTPGNPIVLSAAGGAAGSWYGIVLTPTASGSVLRNVTLVGPQNGLSIGAVGANTLAGITVQGATAYGAWVSAGSPTLEDFRAVGCGSGGLYVTGGSPVLHRCVLVQGPTHGAVFNPAGASTATLDHCTIGFNGGDGVYALGSTSGVLRLQSSIVSNNGGYGVRQTTGSLIVAHSDLWGNSTNLLGAAFDSGVIGSNPLYLAAPSDLRLTSNSPARFGALDGSDMGAYPFLGDPTPGLMGALWGDTTLSAAASPHLVTGDLTVAPGATLTVEPGATLTFAATDAMVSGWDVTKAELVVKGTLIADGSTAPIVLEGAQASKGSWYGIVMAPGASGSTLRGLRIRNPKNGLKLDTTGSNTYSDISVTGAGTYGAWILAGAPALDGFRCSASAFGGVFVTGGSPTLTNCAITGSTYHGIVQNASAGSALTVDHCTVAFNLRHGAWVFGAGTAAIRNSVIARNGFGSVGNGVLREGSASVDVTWSDVWGNLGGDYAGASAGAGCIALDPLLATSGDPRLTAGSPCIDAGQGGAATDLDGLARPIDGDRSGVAQTDIGAFEYVPPIVCGDGVVEGAEECDDGNLDATDGCTSACLWARCGDGFAQAGVEACDDGNTVDGDACTNGCAPATCGDGIVQSGVEECDDGNAEETDGCRNNCLAAVCGDGVVRAGVEECDDGGLVAGDGCAPDCTVEPAPPRVDPPGGCGGCGSAGSLGSPLLLLPWLLRLRRRRRAAP